MHPSPRCRAVSPCGRRRPGSPTFPSVRRPSPSRATPSRRCRVVDLVARLERGRPIRLDDIVDRPQRARTSTGCSSGAVVADAIVQLQANWMADYRNASGIVIEDGRYGPTDHDRGLEPGRSVDRPPGRARSGGVPRGARRLQPPRPGDRRWLSAARDRGPLRVSRRVRMDAARADPTDSTGTRVDRRPDVRQVSPPARSDPPRRPHMTATGYSPTSSSTPTGRRPISTTRASASSRSTSTPTAYEQSHIPGAVGWNWTSQLADGIRRDIAGREDFSALLSAVGHRPGHDDRPLRRQQQLVRRLGLLAAEAVRPPRRPDPQRRPQVLARQRPAADRSTCRAYPATGLPAARRPTSACARSATTSCRGSAMPDLALVDVRSPAEFNGEIIAPPGMTETAQRAGHIPGAASIPWAQTVREDGTFKSADELARAVRGQGRHARQGRHRLLPDRRALVATRGSSCTSCSATTASATTTARGPSGAAWSASRSRRPRPGRCSLVATDRFPAVVPPRSDPWGVRLPPAWRPTLTFSPTVTLTFPLTPTRRAGSAVGGGRPIIRR